MCQTIIINNGEVEIETPNEFKEFFGFDPLVEEYYGGIIGDACLCQVNIEKTFLDHGINFTEDKSMMWYHVNTKNDNLLI